MSTQQPTGALTIRRAADGTPFYEAKWRRNGAQIKRRVGPAWLDADGIGGWKPRRGRVVAGHFNEKQATVRMAQLIAEHDEHESAIERGEVERKARGVTFREITLAWLEWQEQVKRAKPSTLRDWRSMLSEPGVPYKRGNGTSAGRIMAALGDRPAAEITTTEVGRFLRALDGAGVSPRTVNKARQTLSAIFNYARRADTYGLPTNPVEGTDKRREPPPSRLDFYEPDEIEALARAAAHGAHRSAKDDLPTDAVERESELAARRAEDMQDAELYRVLAYTGLRVGEALALRWEDVDLTTRRLIVHRAVSAGTEGPTKSWQARYVPLADPAAQALARLATRGDFTSRDDYVFANRLGGRLDDSSIRRRFKRTCKAAGLRTIKLHSLRHGAGSLLARELDPIAVQAFLGHAKLATTERYMHAKARPEDVARLNRAFASGLVEAQQSGASSHSSTS